MCECKCAGVCELVCTCESGCVNVTECESVQEFVSGCLCVSCDSAEACEHGCMSTSAMCLCGGCECESMNVSVRACGHELMSMSEYV